MPTYQYVCSKCEHEFELYQSMADDALKTCPKDKCPKKAWGKGKVKRVIGAGAGLIFKGSGFYITDYRSENYKAGEKKEASAATGSTGDKGSSANSSDKKASPAKADGPKKEKKPSKE